MIAGAEAHVIAGAEAHVIAAPISERFLPADVLWRPKHGFEIPVDTWLRGPLRAMFESSVLDPQARVRDLVDQKVTGGIYRAHLGGTGRYGNVLWSLLVLARWAERYLRLPAIAATI